MKEIVIPADNLLITDNSNSYPTADQMKNFAKKWSIAEWNKLCFNPQFVTLVSENLEEANKLAHKILSK